MDRQDTGTLSGAECPSVGSTVCQEKYTFQDYRRIVAALRAPDGCPWDRAQTPESLKPCMVNELTEVIAAVNTGDGENLCEELGDLLLQVVFQSQIAEEEGKFTLDDVVQRAAEKMVRRHPHVFPDAEGKRHSMDWAVIKEQEKAGKPPEERARAKKAEAVAAREICAHLKKEYNLREF